LEEPYLVVWGWDGTKVESRAAPAGKAGNVIFARSTVPPVSAKRWMAKIGMLCATLMRLHGPMIIDRNA
jgi:hypothetical protein